MVDLFYFCCKNKSDLHSSFAPGVFNIPIMDGLTPCAPTSCIMNDMTCIFPFMLKKIIADSSHPLPHSLPTPPLLYPMSASLPVLLVLWEHSQAPQTFDL